MNKKKQAKIYGKLFQHICLVFTDNEIQEVIDYIISVFDKRIDKKFKEINQGLEEIIKKLENNNGI